MKTDTSSQFAQESLLLDSSYGLQSFDLADYRTAIHYLCWQERLSYADAQSRKGYQQCVGIITDDFRCCHGYLRSRET